MKQKKLGFLLVMIVGMMLLMSLTAYAGTYDLLIPTNDDSPELLAQKVVRFNGYEWYIIKVEEKTDYWGDPYEWITLFAKEPITEDMYGKYGYKYEYIKDYLANLASGSFNNVQIVIPPVSLEDVGVTAKIWLLSVSEARALPVNVRKCSRAEGTMEGWVGEYWWLRSKGHDVYSAAVVNGSTGQVNPFGFSSRVHCGIRPALKIRPDWVDFDSSTKTFRYHESNSYLYPVTIEPIDKEIAWSSGGVTVPMEEMFTIKEGSGERHYSVTNLTGEGTYDENTHKLTVTKCGLFKVSVETKKTEVYEAGRETSAMLFVYTVAQIATAPTAKDLTYTGSAQELVNAGATNDGTLYYAVTTGNAAPTDDSLYTESIPTATEAGTYYVWYKVIGDDSHKDSSLDCVQVTIGPKSLAGPGLEFFRLYEDCLLPETGFSGMHPSELSAQPKELQYNSLRMELQIPTIDAEMELVTVPLADKAWQVKWLQNKAGVLEGSALPGEGISVVAAHNTLNNTEYGPFALLSTVEVNDVIMVNNRLGSMKMFRVYANELLDADGMAQMAAIAGEAENPLILVTCENESTEGGYLNRRVIFARPN